MKGMHQGKECECSVCVWEGLCLKGWRTENMRGVMANNLSVRDSDMCEKEGLIG